MKPAAKAAEIAPLVQQLLDAIAHRGPDDEGCWATDGLAIGMRRLSIIDLAGGHQPMQSDDRQIQLVFNGEIYNFRQLRDALSAAGCVFRTLSDTEVILHGYRIWGREVVDRLNGMFAFALYDGAARELFVARDHFGIKPLYYHAAPGQFAFCSEPAPLLELPGVERRLDLGALHHFLAYKYVPSPDTFVSSVRKLAPATWLRVGMDGTLIEERRYWHWGDDQPTAESEEQLAEILRETVDRQLVADVPVGVFLSGGIDSGLLLWAAGASGHEACEAFTVRFDDPRFDETPQAASVAQHLGARHHIEDSPQPTAEDLEGFVKQFGEPFANVSVPANFALSRATARRVKVALNGSGGDEMFAGYDRYFAVCPPWSLRWASAAAPVLLPLCRQLPVGRSKRSLVTRARRYLESAGGSPAVRHAHSVRLFTSSDLAAAAPDLRSGADPILDRFAAAPLRDDLTRATWVDVETMLADDYLTLVDRTSMAASLEIRVPFLDRELAALAFHLPAEAKIRGYEKKRALRRLAKRVLPESIACAPKQGFESPVASWFRGPLGDQLREELAASPLRDIVRPVWVASLVDDHRAGRRDAAKQLLALSTLCTWLRQGRIGI